MNWGNRNNNNERLKQLQTREQSKRGAEETDCKCFSFHEVREGNLIEKRPPWTHGTRMATMKEIMQR